MKKLTMKEFVEAPDKVRYIYIYDGNYEATYRFKYL